MVESIGFICGQCHGREAALFRDSAKHAGFLEHNEEHLPEMGAEGCASCHEPPEQAASVRSLTSLNECSACHGNHGVVRPTVAQLAPELGTPCAMCRAAQRRSGSAGRATGERAAVSGTA